MTKITLSNLASLTNETTAITTINANFGIIEAAIDDLLSRDGTSPNSMEANLDMNSYRIQNLPEASDPTEPVRLGDLSALVAGDITPSRWYAGSGAPSNSAYEVGDFYLRTDTADVYEKTASNAWTLKTNIKGATGDTGPIGPSGAGTGDMLKSTYDTNNNGIVDAAASVPWSGVTSKPTTLSGYGITDAQPLATKLTNFNALTWGANTFPYFTGTNTVVAGQLTSAGLALLDDADAAAQRVTLGLGTMALRNTISTGDLAAGAATLAKLDTTGAAGLVLTANGVGNAPSWKSSAGSSSGHVLLSTLTTSGVSTLTASGLTLTNYRRLYVSFVGVKGSSALTSTTFNMTVTVPASATTSFTSSLNGNSSGNGFLEVDLASGAGNYAFAVAANGVPTLAGARAGVTNATTSINFTVGTGNFGTGGTIRIYGVL